MPEKLDGCGNPIDPDAYYYIQDTRTIVGNCASFWREEGHGYTCDFDDAGLFLGSDSRVHGDRSTDVPWPAALVRAARRTFVDVQQLYALR